MINIIAEIGVNHDGSIDKAIELADAAISAGADTLKTQMFKSSTLATKEARLAKYQLEQLGREEAQGQMLKRLEFDLAMHRTLRDYCRLKGLSFLSSPFDITDIQRLMDLDITTFKIPSGELVNIPYLRVISNVAKKVILSTGMSTLEEIERALRILTSNGLSCLDITLLQCVSDYPAAREDMNIRVIETYKQAFGTPVGLSDHSDSLLAASVAVALGATCVEKHLTLNKSGCGPDHAASLEPREFGVMVDMIRETEQLLGVPSKVVVPAEERNLLAVRKSIVAKRMISKGEIFSDENLTAKRPGDGVSVARWDEVLGRSAPRNFEIDEQINL